LMLKLIDVSMIKICLDISLLILNNMDQRYLY
jgi:hypothetical protein